MPAKGWSASGGENYTIAENVPEDINKELAEYPEFLRQLLFNRGIETKEKAEKFLNPSYEEDLHDPFLLLGMDKAVKRILEAVEKGEEIIVYGDYDCDGIPGSVILHDFFKKIGYENFEVYIPDRHKEGYGLHKHAIEQFSKEDVKLLITVDLGITNVDEVEFANSLGIDVIITDHHLPGPTLPNAFAILNPKQEGDKYPFKELCGAGVAFKLVQALIKKIKEDFQLSTFNFQLPAEGWEKWLIDMAGLATLSDMVSLRGENRALAYFGLKVLRRNRRPGLEKLLQNLKINKYYLTEDDISFMINPRLNAASRMDSPRRAFDLLSTQDESAAGMLADHLTQINDQRKTLVATILRDVKRTLTKRDLSVQAGEKEVIVIGNPKWRLGVLGLVASRIVEEYGCPAFVWCKENGCIKGSCRSDGSVNLVEMMRETKDGTLLDFGGHELAGGFSVSHDKIHFLEDELIDVYRKTKRETHETNDNLVIDRKLSLDDVTMENYKLIEKLAPFGMDNPKPIFLFEGVEIAAVKKFGKDKNHLEVSFRKEDGNPVKAISFFKQPDSFSVSLEPECRVNLVANLEKNTFHYRTELRLRIVDIFI